MSKTFKKLISLVIVATLSMSFLLVGMTVFGEDLIAINATNFPDANFRQIVSECYDLDGNGYLDANERVGEYVTTFDLSARIENDYEGMQIESIQGIEYFQNIETLYCSGIGLKSLNMARMPFLKYLYCGGNEFTTLSLINNNSLISLKCGGGELENIIFPTSPNLKIVHCYSNNLTNLNVSTLSGLVELSCHNNELTSLNLSNNRRLTTLICSNNHITSLDLSNNPIDPNLTTPVMIGNQHLTVFPIKQSDIYVVPFVDYGVNNTNYISSNLEDFGNGYGFNGSSFYAADADALREGIDYYCSTFNESLPELEVHIKTAYKVDFYYDDELMDYIGYAMVFPGETAVVPELEWTPMCKAVDYWSESIDNVQDDMEVYAIWKDDHTPALEYLAVDNDTMHIDCSVCHNTGYDLSYISIVNTKSGDEAFDEVADINNDGYINAKDYAVIYRDYKLQPEAPEEDEPASEPTE